MDMLKKVVAVCLIAISLTACASQEVGKITPVFGGSANGGYDLQTACSAVMNAAGCTLNTRTADGRIDMQQAVLKNSVQGNVTEAVTTVGVSKTLDWTIARDLQRNQPDCDGDCNKNGDQQVTNVNVQTTSGATATNTSRDTTGCGATPCLAGNVIE
jgi:hypothetical protein